MALSATAFTKRFLVAPKSGQTGFLTFDATFAGTYSGGPLDLSSIAGKLSGVNPKDFKFMDGKGLGYGVVFIPATAPVWTNLGQFGLYAAGKEAAAGTLTSAAKSGGNTGNGTCTPDVTTPLLTGAQVGVYTVRCTAAALNNGTFVLTDPLGNVIQTVVMSGGAGTFNTQIKFALADGATDFIVGDGFDLTVAGATVAGTIPCIAVLARG